MTLVARRAISLLALASPLALAPFAAGCGSSGAEQPYVPQPAYSGKKASMPAVPTLPQKPIKVGDAYTVWGLQHHLRSRVHNPDVANKDVTVVGYIVKTNLAEAPKCAVHKTGKGDKDDCKAPVPAFWIADEKGDDKNAIKVMGWASNFANIYDAIEKYSVKTNKDVVKDEFWGGEIPNPIPNVGAKVQLAATYGVGFSKSTQGVETDPIRGLLTFSKMTYLEPPPEPGTLPGMKKP